MDNVRVFLWGGLALLLWMNFQTWQQNYPPLAPSAPAAQAGIDRVPELPTAAPTRPAAGVLPGAAELPVLPDAPTDRGSASAPSSAAVGRDMITVTTDVLQLRIDLLGGDIHIAKLLEYPVHKDQPDVPVQLLSTDAADYFVFRTGLRTTEGRPEANHQSRFTSERASYVLGDGDDALMVRLKWQGEGDIHAEKIYRFTRGSYAIGFEQRVSNDSAQPYPAVSYLQIQRLFSPPERSMFDVDSYSFVGPVISDGEKYEKLDADDLAEEPVTQQIIGGWIASIQHHFLVAAVPQAEEVATYHASFDGKFTLVSIIDGEFTNIAPGDTGAFAATLFVGPKLQSQLHEIADNLPLTVDYGRLGILARPLFWLLQKVYDVVGNWGWTIIFVTFLIKLVFYKLTQKSGRSMAKMRKLAPRLKSVQERYKDDREQLSRAMMDLYKREKVNPAAGCWPMLIQIPFFIAFYWVLLESVEMRQAPFMLWITDLSSRDPVFVLPLLMGGAMYFQQKLNPPPPDPMQAKVMQFLPIMFTGMFAFFPAGLVLYWLTNSVLSMAQQWRINKVIGAD
ncbi:MAG: membrane protein insertase YidC [Gammaproteobacteria bacterium]|nr:MAG: membrane protein insertase YidC [Gammaproteobacteria bacterium]